MKFTRERYGLWFIESLEGTHELTFIQNKSHIIATYLWASYLHRVQIGILRFCLSPLVRGSSERDGTSGRRHEANGSERTSLI